MCIRAPTPSSSTATIPTRSRISFDDGPDPKWTPKILDILKQKNVKGTFMMIGAEAQENIGLMQRVYARRQRDRQPHLYASRHQRNLSTAGSISRSTSPSACSPASSACSRSTSVRPTTSTRSPTPTTRPRPSCRIQNEGYIIIGNKIDTDDWNERPPQDAAGDHQSVLEQLQTMKTKPQFRGSIILMHDGGGDRSATVAALPVLIDALRAHGYTIVPVSALMGKTTARGHAAAHLLAMPARHCPTPSPSPRSPSSATSSSWSSSSATS